MIRWFLISRDVEQDVLDPLQDVTINSTSWGDRGELAKEADGTSQEALETILVDELAQILGAPDCRKDKHVSELPVWY